MMQHNISGDRNQSKLNMNTDKHILMGSEYFILPISKTDRRLNHDSETLFAKNTRYM